MSEIQEQKVIDVLAAILMDVLRRRGRQAPRKGKDGGEDQDDEKQQGHGGALAHPPRA
jgi:hypothetical protein